MQSNVNFVRELSSRAHFIDDFMLIKICIGTMPLTLFFLLFYVQVNLYVGEATIPR